MSERIDAFGRREVADPPLYSRAPYAPPSLDRIEKQGPAYPSNPSPYQVRMVKGDGIKYFTRLSYNKGGRDNG